MNDTRPPDLDTSYTSQKAFGDGLNVSVTEGEAQTSKPTDENFETTPSPALQKPKWSKLRPRKAAMSLTPTAIIHLRSLLAQPEPKLIRVGVKNRGCSGLAYHLEFVEKQGMLDECVEQDGVKVLIDSKALFSIIGSEMDWVEDKLNQRFVFRNPNISKSSTFEPSRVLTDSFKRSNVVVGSLSWFNSIHTDKRLILSIAAQRRRSGIS